MEEIANLSVNDQYILLHMLCVSLKYHAFSEHIEFKHLPSSKMFGKSDPEIKLNEQPSAARKSVNETMQFLLRRYWVVVGSWVGGAVNLVNLHNDYKVIYQATHINFFETQLLSTPHNLRLVLGFPPTIMSVDKF